jgi:hypothetical protein
MEQVRDERVKQVAIAASILISLAVVVSGTLVGWRFLPGLLGEWVGTMIGIITTPFFMEASFAILGLVIVITLNHWRISRDGDEFVEMEIPSEPTVTLSTSQPANVLAADRFQTQK